MRFRNREEAAALLAERLTQYQGDHPLVLGIPRGGMPMARVIAQRLGAELDVMLVHKLRAPFQPELAVGAIDEAGRVYLTPFASDLAIAERDLDAEKHEQLAILKRRRERYTAAHPRVSLAGRTVILVDDGLATGATAIAAVRAARADRAGRIVVAVGVAPVATVSRLRAEADDVVCLHAPADFGAVGAFFTDFSEVTDDEVVRLLAESRADAAASVARAVQVPVGRDRLAADLSVPGRPRGLVIFAHGSGSGRHSPRNQAVAQALQSRGLATLLADLLTTTEEAKDRVTASLRFDIELLGRRVVALVDWVRQDPRLRPLRLGLFGASTGAAAALVAAAARPDDVAAVVSRGGRPDLAGNALAEVRAPTLLLVGSLDTEVIDLNQWAKARMSGPVSLSIVPGASHLFEEPGTLEEVASKAGAWFVTHLGQPSTTTTADLDEDGTRRARKDSKLRPPA